MNRSTKLGIAVVIASSAMSQTHADNVIINGDFNSGKVSPWEFGSWEGSIASISTSDGRVCVNVVDPGPENWDIQFRQNNMAFEVGHTYNFSADVWSSKPVELKVDGSAEPPGGYVWHFGDTYNVDAPLTGSPQTITGTFLNEEETNIGKFAFLMGESLVPADTQVCFDNIVLDDPQAVVVPDPSFAPLSKVVVNQHAYLPDLIKTAVYIVPEGQNTGSARPWQLMRNGAVVASGMTVAEGNDAASGDYVHSIDFSSVSAEGDGYSLVVSDTAGADHTSFPFSISRNAYSQMKYDALSYFYHNRSSTDILASIVGDEYARDAGHPDTAVDTAACTSSGAGCRTVNVTGGWYDAGDHGKYVVNGGISVWTMLNQYERSKNQGHNLADFADGAMALPNSEQTNGLPDILDEAKWEVDWFLKMQIPAGEQHAGMVYQKVHTDGWTGIPTLPSTDNGLRIVQPPSTAATLNFAAVTAQCYRLYREFDSAYANSCLEASRVAYAAAKNTQPELLAVNSDGSGTYGDSNRSDEFFWAATELYLSTGENGFRTDMENSAYFNQFFNGATPLGGWGVDQMAWPSTQTLGIISLATTSEEFVRDSDLRRDARSFILARADEFVAESEAQGYGLPYRGQSAGWGSNSSVVNNMIILGLANDFVCSTNDRYLNAMQKGMNYLMGNNPLDQSYITGYGERPTKAPHHRFWAKAANANFPAPPAGVISGGPNRGLEDPLAKVDLANCVTTPLKCYMDNIESWSTNEITINWNAPFAWVVAYMDEQADPNNRAATQACATGPASSSSSSSMSSSVSSAQSSSVVSSVSSQASSSSSSSPSGPRTGGAFGLLELIILGALSFGAALVRARKSA